MKFVGPNLYLNIPQYLILVNEKKKTVGTVTINQSPTTTEISASEMK